MLCRNSSQLNYIIQCPFNLNVLLFFQTRQIEIKIVQQVIINENINIMF